MLLALSVENTNISIGGYELLNGRLLFVSQISTQTSLTVDEYAVKFLDILKLNGFSPNDIEGTAVSNVVTPISDVIKNAVKKLSDKKVLSIGPGVKTGINIKIDDPAVLGADLVCGAVSAVYKHSSPCIVIELGTATVISAVDKNGFFCGTSIVPGVKLSLNALSSSAAQLPDVSVDYDGKKLIGTNTAMSMQSGIIVGTACMLDGMIQRFREHIGDDAKVICTGEFAKKIIPHCKLKEDIILEETLLLDGLYIIYKKNV